MTDQEILENFLKIKGIKDQQAEPILGVSRTTLSKIRNGRQAMSKPVKLLIARELKDLR